MIVLCFYVITSAFCPLSAVEREKNAEIGLVLPWRMCPPCSGVLAATTQSNTQNMFDNAAGYRLTAVPKDSGLPVQKERFLP